MTPDKYYFFPAEPKTYENLRVYIDDEMLPMTPEETTVTFNNVDIGSADGKRRVYACLPGGEVREIGRDGRQIMTPEMRARTVVQGCTWGANIVDPGGSPTADPSYLQTAIATAIREAVEEEREACASVCDEHNSLTEFGAYRPESNGASKALHNAASAIRARSKEGK